ncbi:MAG: DUF86 domain-containing protein [Planctomycetes bacterium]|nr:DUF86 domain-containing protein [Planctomycetota bacterium]
MRLDDDTVRMRHMLEAAQEAMSFTAKRTRDDLDSDRKLVLALIKCIEIIGEPASHVSPTTRAKQSHLDWPDVVGMRNRLIHMYYDVNLDVVWSTVCNDLPPLVQQLKKILPPGDP